MIRETKAQKAADARIERLYRERCSGIQINIMDIGKVFTVGRQAIADGATDETLGNRIATFVDSIRRN